MKTLEELMALRAEKLAEMKDLNSKHPNMDEAVEAQYNALDEEFKGLTRQIELKKTEDGLRNQVDAIFDSGIEAKKQSSAQMSSLMAYARKGVVDAQNAVVNGAVLIPQTYSDKILSDLENYVAIRKFATVRKTNGTYNMPIGGATPTFGWIDEGGSYPTPDLSFTNKTIDAYKTGAIVLVPEELLADEQFDLESYLAEQIVAGIAENENEAFITGNGIKKPTGVANDVASELTRTLSVLDTIALTDIEDVFLAVPSKARKNGQWVISDKLYRAAFRMKDSTGNYILREGQNGEISTLFGKPFEVNDSMLGGTGEPLAIFGKLEDYVIGDRGEMAIQRLDEKYADEGYVGFKVYKRTDGKLARNKYVSKLVNA